MALEAEVRNRWVLEGMLRMEYAAINIGELEVIKETDRWSELEKVAELPFISANAVVPAGSHLKFSPYVIREVDIFEGRSIRVGLLGLAEPESGSLAIEFADPVEKARELVADLDSKCDVLVVLAQLPLPAAKELVKAVPAIDVLVGAAAETHLPKPSLEGDTLICYPYPQGMGLGELRLFFDQDGRPARFFYRLVPLSSQLKDHPDFVEFQQKAEAEIEAAKSQ